MPVAEVAVVERRIESSRDQAIPADQARGVAQEFLLRNLKDTLTAGRPTLLIVAESLVWRVPIIFAHPARTFGEVGQVLVDATSGEVIGWTPSDEVYRNAQAFLVA